MQVIRTRESKVVKTSLLKNNREVIIRAFVNSLNRF